MLLLGYFEIFKDFLGIHMFCIFYFTDDSREDGVGHSADSQLVERPGHASGKCSSAVQLSSELFYGRYNNAIEHLFKSMLCLVSL